VLVFMRERVHVCVCVMYHDKENGGALGLLGGETTMTAMANAYRRARQPCGFTMGLRWLEWRCSGRVCAVQV